MKKLNKMGFMLTETLIVASFVIATLVFLYTQFRTVSRSYAAGFKYNNAEQLYALENMSDYLKTENLTAIGLAINETSEEYVDITSCPSNAFERSVYCNALVDSLRIKQLIVTNENLGNFVKATPNISQFSEEMKTFISSIKYKKSGTNYRLIAEFLDGTFATITVKEW